MTTPDPTAPLEPTTARQHAIRHLADLVHGSGAQAVFPVIDAIADMIREQVAAAVGPVRDGLRLHVEADHSELYAEMDRRLVAVEAATPTAADMDTQRVERVAEAVASVRDEVATLTTMLSGHFDDHAELDRRLVALEAATPTAVELEEIDQHARAYGFEVGRGRPLSAQLSTSDDNPFVNKGWRDSVPATDQPVNLGATRRLAGTSPVAAGGCDDCSVEPGERHRFPTCPGAVRAELRSIEREDLLLRVAGFANRIAADGLSPGLNRHVLQLLAESLLSLATDAYRPITGDDARCRLARVVLDALDVPR